MRTSRIPIAVLASLVALLFVGQAAAQTVPVDIEFGYQFVDVTGNKDMYRSQVNEREGFLLRAFNLDLGDLDGKTTLFDHMRVDVADIGASPAGVVRAEVGRSGTYRLRLLYTRDQHFSALPAFANSFLASGIVPGQHTSDRTRNSLDVNLELLPGKKITPILGYTRSRTEGPGQTTYTIGQDEFRLSSDVKDTDQELRVGVLFDEGPVSGQLIQGWRQFTGKETLTLAPGAGAGNNTGTVLDTPVSLTSFTRVSDTTVNAPVTTANVTGRLFPELKILASYVRTAASGDGTDQEDAAGTLVSFELSRFFRGLSESVAANAKNTFWRGNARLDWNVATGVDFSAGYTRRHRELDGFALLTSLYLTTTSFAGQDPKNVQALLQASTALERTENVYDVTASARALGPVSLRASWSQADQDVTVTPDASEIVLAGGQGGTFSRSVSTFDAGIGISLSTFTVGFDWRQDRGDKAVIRTDFRERDRYRIRASVQPVDWIKIGGDAEQVDSKNMDLGIGYDGRMRQYAGRLELKPWKPFRLHASASKYEADSTIGIRRPQDGLLDSSVHVEDGKSYEGGFWLELSPIKLEAGLGRFTNEGSFAFTIQRARALVDMELTKSISVVGEWARDKYLESAQHLGDFDGNRYGVYVRLKQ